MGNRDLVSLMDVEGRFYAEDLELLTTINCSVEVTIYHTHYVQRRGSREIETSGPAIELRFGDLDGRPATEYVAEVEMLPESMDLAFLEQVFGIAPSDPVWNSGQRHSLHLEDALKGLYTSSHAPCTTIVNRNVEIALYRGQNDDGIVNDAMGIQLHFAPPNVDVNDEDDSYNCCAWMEAKKSGKELFRFEDVASAFSVDWSARIWAVQPCE